MSGCDRDSDVSRYIDVSGYCSIVTVIPLSDTSHTNHCHYHWYILYSYLFSTKIQWEIIAFQYHNFNRVDKYINIIYEDIIDNIY